MTKARNALWLLIAVATVLVSQGRTSAQQAPVALDGSQDSAASVAARRPRVLYVTPRPYAGSVWGAYGQAGSSAYATSGQALVGDRPYGGNFPYSSMDFLRSYVDRHSYHGASRPDYRQPYYRQPVAGLSFYRNPYYRQPYYRLDALRRPYYRGAYYSKPAGALALSPKPYWETLSGDK